MEKEERVAQKEMYRITDEQDKLQKEIDKLDAQMEALFAKKKELFHKFPTLRFRREPLWEYCDDCDGCGWAEGGATIKTLCNTCKGSGKVRESLNR